MDSIVAISTALYNSAIGVIRLTGDDCIVIASSVFKRKNGDDIFSISPSRATLGSAYSSKGDLLDNCMVTVFKAPFSYTGEDMVEFSCHGGITVLKSVLSALLDAGARLATAGEFTKRAFLNGKQNLMQSEAVIDVIEAKTPLAQSLALLNLNGGFSNVIDDISEQLQYILAKFFAYIDYPEDEIDDTTNDEIIQKLRVVLSDINKLVASFERGRVIKEGVSATILGVPNVGKSSFLNYITNSNRSIVTEIAGTTRDIVEASANLGGILVNISDTAGIHDTSDVVENIGISRAFENANTADFIFAIFDGSAALSDDDLKLIEFLKDKNVIAVLNKADLDIKVGKDILISHFSNVIEFSAKTGFGFDTLCDTINSMFLHGEIISDDSKIISSIRHRDNLSKCSACISSAIDSASSGVTLDAVTGEIEASLTLLLEITGRQVSDDVLASIFKNFCVGK